MARGGKRKGAGRPKGTGKFGEPTKAVRLPISKIEQILAFIARQTDTYPVYEAGKKPETKDCDLIPAIIENPSSTFTVRFTGDSMKGASIFDGDLLVCDRSAEPQNGDVIVFELEKKLAVRRMVVKKNTIELKAENSAYQTIKVTDPSSLSIMGVVKKTLHTV